MSKAKKSTPVGKQEAIHARLNRPMATQQAQRMHPVRRGNR